MCYPDIFYNWVFHLNSQLNKILEHKHKGNELTYSKVVVIVQYKANVCSSPFSLTSVAYAFFTAMPCPLSMNLSNGKEGKNQRENLEQKTKLDVVM